MNVNTSGFFIDNRRFYVSIICICLMIVIPDQAYSTDRPDLPKVTLQSVLDDITKTNPAILEALEYYQSVAAERAIAESEYYPTVGAKLVAGPERTEQEELSSDPDLAGQGVKEDSTTDLTSTTAELFLRQNLYNGGKTSAFVDETDARISAAAFEVLNVANNVYLEASEAYLGVVKAVALLKIAEQNAYTQEKIMRQVREKTEAGFNRVSELYNSEARLALSKGNYISRQQDLNQALAVFHRHFGRILLPEQFVSPEPRYEVPAELAQTVDNAFKSHPALKVAQYNILTRRYGLDKTNAAYFPTLDLELKGEYSNNTNGEEGDIRQTGAYLTISYDFYDGGLRAGQKARDQRAVRKEQQRAYIERRNVNESVRLAWNIMVAEKSKAAYLNEHVLLSAKTLKAFKEEYYVGRRTLLDLLNMENEYTDAKLAESDSHFSYLASIYRIMHATGELLNEYDTGLREQLTLPEELSQDQAEIEELLGNRDNDAFNDKNDQCDNSLPDSSGQAFGCMEEAISKTGYPQDDDIPLTPYILPQDVVVSSTVSRSGEQEIPSDKIDAPAKHNIAVRLDVKPDSDCVTAQSKSQLEELTETLRVQSNSTVIVEGYIASDSNSAENIALSQRRADTVRRYMIEHGIKPERITAVGRGNANQLASNDSSDGRKKNRRIEIKVSSIL